MLYKGGEQNCLRSAFKENGIGKLISGHMWNIYWGKHLDEADFRNLNEVISQFQNRKKYSLLQSKSSMLKCLVYILTQSTFPSYMQFQKVNHFPGSWNLGRKDRLSRNFTKMRRKFPKAYDFFAKTFIMPEDALSLKREIKGQAKSLWIVKPSASACGRGIRVMQAADLTKKGKMKNCIAQVN